MTLGVIGCGKMGSALVEGIIGSGVCSGQMTFLYDSHGPAAQALANKTGARVAESGAAVVSAADVILVCVKPQGMEAMLRELGDSRDKLIISIAAGVRIGTIQEALGNRHRVVRVMPNTPALVGKGAAGFALGSKATNEDAAVTRRLFASVGCAFEVAESDLDAVTALSGSGPAYVFFLIEALVSAAVKQGLNAEIALNLATQTVAGAAEMVQQTGEEPAVLRENVTSPKGTTFAALESFRANGFAQMVEEALNAARDRSIELGRQ